MILQIMSQDDNDFDNNGILNNTDYKLKYDNYVKICWLSDRTSLYTNYNRDFEIQSFRQAPTSTIVDALAYAFERQPR